MAWKWNWPLPDEWFESDKGGIKKTSTLSPQQEAIMSQLSTYLSSQFGKGATTWGRPFTAPLSGFEQIGLGQLQNYLNQGVGPTAQLGLDTYQQALKGMSPEEVANYYQKYIAPSENRYLKEVSIPTFKESMVPGGTLRSTGTERGIADVIAKHGEGQLGRIGEMIMNERAGARSALSLLPTMAGIEGGVPQMEAAFQYGQLPRMIEQAELTGKIEEFRRANPDMSSILDKMLSFLGVTTTAAYNQPYTPSPFLQFLASAAPGVGSGIGSYLALA